MCLLGNRPGGGRYYDEPGYYDDLGEMTVIKVLIWGCFAWQVCRLIWLSPSLLRIAIYKWGGEEQREIKARQDRAIDRRIKQMHEQLAAGEVSNREMLENLSRFSDATGESIRASTIKLNESRMRHIRASCDSDIEKIRRSYWGYIE
ncbi:hypothetical protein Ahp2_55 [Aeromonas phage Ahp2]|nr:hypothetical protein Ahp2_55 [Aeromonas phage Ahp2]